jgi:hypothetical protein
MTEKIWTRTGRVVACFKNDSEPPGSIKCKEFLDCQRKKSLLKKDSGLSSWLVTNYQFTVSTEHACTQAMSLRNLAPFQL